MSFLFFVLLVFQYSFAHGQDDNSTVDTSTVFSFKVSRSFIGDSESEVFGNSSRKIRITGYENNLYRDTVEIFKSLQCSKKNAFQLYQKAYDLPANRFIFSNQLAWINSSLPNYLYRMDYSISNLVGDYHLTLQKQLDIFFKLKSSITLRDTNVLVLKKVVPIQ